MIPYPGSARPFRSVPRPPRSRPSPVAATATPSASLPRLAALALLFTALAALASAAWAQRTVEVTVTNTSPHVVSPPLLISHGSEWFPLALGAAATPELARLAEDGDNAELARIAALQLGVLGVVRADAPLEPGASLTLRVEASEDAHYLTVLGMLVTTNDAVAVWGRDLASDAMSEMTGDMGSDMMGDAASRVFYDGLVRVVDAGSEANTESCEHIPGPPCGSAGVRATDGAEGSVALHGGVIGVGDLDPAEWDWTNPALEVTLASDDAM